MPSRFHHLCMLDDRCKWWSFYEFWVSHNGVNLDSARLFCWGVSVQIYFSTFRRVIISPCSEFLHFPYLHSYFPGQSFRHRGSACRPTNATDYLSRDNDRIVICDLILQTQKWTDYIPPKPQSLFTIPHRVATQKITKWNPSVCGLSIVV